MTAREPSLWQILLLPLGVVLFASGAWLAVMLAARIWGWGP